MVGPRNWSAPRGLHSVSTAASRPPIFEQITRHPSGCTLSFPFRAPNIGTHHKSAIHLSRICVWVVATAVALAAVAACFGPQTSNDYYERGVARFKDDKYKGAVADFSKAISIRPKYTAAYIGRGDARIGLGQYEEAIADFDQALQLQPDDPNVQYSRGIAKFMLGRYRGAIADFDQAIRLQPHKAYTHYLRGQAKSSIGLHKEAIADWQASLELANEANDSDLIASIERRIQEYERK